jgi:L-alanine-DL-glutamate epimerase-like enolase superfamily enzyme
MHRRIARHALGKDPAKLDQICDSSISANLKYPWSYVCRALSGLDTAIWDLLGKREGKSVCELLGGKPGFVPIYGSSMSRSIKPSDEAARLKKLRETKGVRAFKIRIGSGCGTNADKWPGRSEQNVRTCRKELGDGIALLVDGNSCYTPDKAIEVGNTYLAENKVCHFEEPCPYWELEWTARVTDAIEVPVAGGEQDNDLAQWRRMIKMNAVDIVQPDINYIGGLTRALRVAQWASEAGKLVVPHSANLSMVTLFSLHMMAAIKNAGGYVEYSIESSRSLRGMFEPALSVESIRDGKVAIPAGPGWGVKIGKRWLEDCKRQVTKI